MAPALLAGSVALIGFGVDSSIEVISDLAMLPVILWQGWETLGEAREHDDEHEDSQ